MVVRKSYDVSPLQQITSIKGVSPNPEKDAEATATDANAGTNCDSSPSAVPKHGASFWGVVSHLVVISLGPVLLTIPSTFIPVGYVLGIVGTVLTVLLYAHCMRILVNVEEEYCRRTGASNLTYVQVLQEAMGSGPQSVRWMTPYVKILIYVVFLTVWLGFNCVTFILAARYLKSAVDFFGADYTFVPVPLTTVQLALIVPLVLLCWIPNLKLLVPCSMYTNSINAWCVLTVFYEIGKSFMTSPPDTTASGERIAFGDILALPKLIGVQLVCITATCFILSMKNELKKRHKFASPFGVITCSYLPVMLVYSSFGSLCYLQYGEQGLTQGGGDIFQNLPANTLYKTMIGLYGIGVCFLYPLAAYASYDVIRNMALKEYFEGVIAQNKGHVPMAVTAWEYLIRTVVGAVPIVAAYLIPDVNIFLTLAGTVGSSVDSIIIPPLLQILADCCCSGDVHGGVDRWEGSVRPPKKHHFRIVKNFAIFIFGIVLLFMGIRDFIISTSQSN